MDSKIKIYVKNGVRKCFFRGKKNTVRNGWQMLVNKKLVVVNDGRQWSTTKHDGQPKSTIKYMSQCQLQVQKVNDDVVID